MYPIKLKGDLKEKIWGGKNLKEYGKDMESTIIGESWEIACHNNGESLVDTGEYEGYSLCDVLEVERENIIKNYTGSKEFPLLVKFIDANDDLSIQVHPNDEYSRKHGEHYGKNESWYILDSKKGAKITLGVKDGFSAEDVTESIALDDPYRCLNQIEVKAGELYYVPSGTVHAIGKGIVLLEIQQSSDLTYRLYDYKRGRELHLKEALEVIDTDNNWRRGEVETQFYETYELTKLLQTHNFSIDKIRIFDTYVDENTQNDFEILTCVSGSGELLYKELVINFIIGDSILIGADTKSYVLNGNCEIIKSYIDKNIS